ncbi:hypothetical protein RV11_GL002539 [Enterococcus phoeniculicola]|jgi:TRAP-type C4-dicarboxylate transport system permease small subunit|uniref:Uncharacterized protein n=1 Tax=Enterococcus phoeniculicola ATCC BAA-412 TaxID=1158610 RepID=R3TX39_9ENTE|nr:hypothetical protein [Enterococcus phoeniculicola]EOL46174.1 hypothetical protein UC3_00980 [Enterococcus phoeniculicola ATCC BAA-412]EOT76981.1 hypothetical protein I589_01942 [Enterococcus phoeniculicola ATCC BAA-412]OJG69548.1 hypothetical protein RV11_GL002539 [Enterococcus phoeniculicola]
MLNPYFAFGVPLFLFIIYIVFYILRKKTTLHFLGFILLIISGFLTVFSLQVWQQAISEMENESLQTLSQEAGYPIYLLWVPIIIGFLLVFINFIRAVKKLREIQQKKEK